MTACLPVKRINSQVLISYKCLDCNALNDLEKIDVVDAFNSNDTFTAIMHFLDTEHHVQCERIDIYQLGLIDMIDSAKILLGKPGIEEDIGMLMKGTEMESWLNKHPGLLSSSYRTRGK